MTITMTKNVIKIFITLAVIVMVMVIVSGLANAQAKPADCPPGTTCLIVALPGVPQKITNPAEYIVGIYRFGLGIGGIFAMVIIVYAGIKRIVSAGNPSAIGDANDMIYNAIWGLVLLLGAFLILNTINPRLVQLRAPVLPKVSTTGGGFSGVAGTALSYAQQLDKASEKSTASCGD